MRPRSSLHIAVIQQNFTSKALLNNRNRRKADSEIHDLLLPEMGDADFQSKRQLVRPNVRTLFLFEC
jgi:hypothetical protein